ncbi:MAG: restriction endonuclease [Candidatus Dormibacter sp.]
MTVATFDDLIAIALSEYGYEDIQLIEHDDDDADLVARRNARRMSIHVKRCEGRVDETAVAQALRRKVARHCSGAMVIASSVFTHEARRVAKQRGVTLWDQDDLANLLESTGIASRARTTVPNCLTCGAPMTLLWQLQPAWGCSNIQPCAGRVKYRKWVITVAADDPTLASAVGASASADSQPSPAGQIAASALPHQRSPAQRRHFSLRSLRPTRVLRSHHHGLHSRP